MELVSNYFNKIELSIISIIIFFTIFHQIFHYILFERFLDKAFKDRYIVAYKKIRYYSLKIIVLIIFLLLLILIADEFYKYSESIEQENIEKYSAFFGLVGLAITIALQEVVLSSADSIKYLLVIFFHSSPTLSSVISGIS